MSLALYAIGSTIAVVLLSARLRDAREELARVRDEYAAYAHGVAVSLACLLAGLAVWYAPPRPASRPGNGRAGAREGAAAGGPGQEAGR